MKNNSIFLKGEGDFYKKTNKRSDYKGQVPTMDKSMKFLAGILENERETPSKKWVEKSKENMKDKIRQVEELQTTEQELRKNN